QLFYGGGVVGADEAFFFAVGLTTAQPLNELALGDDWPAARPVVAFRSIADRRLPDGLSRFGVERHQACVARGGEHLVVVNGDPSHGRAVGVLTVAVFPNHVTGPAVDRLHHVAGIIEIDDAVVNDRSRLVRSAFIHGPDPLQTEIAD